MPALGLQKNGHSPSDWNEHVHVTGYFFLTEETYQPPGMLSDFLAKGDTPICISFESMVNRKAKHIDEIVCEALKRTNNRGVILSSWGCVTRQSSNDLLYLESAPHAWLLPKCKMVIHHGGTGTTSARRTQAFHMLLSHSLLINHFWETEFTQLVLVQNPFV